MDAYEIDNTSYKKTEQNRIAAFGFNCLGVSAAVRPFSPRICDDSDGAIFICCTSEQIPGTTAKRRRNQYGFQNREKS